MSTASPSTDRWVVSTRVHGEVLTAEAQIGGLEVRLLGLPEGFSQAEVEGWIGSLAAAALEGAGAAIPEDPLPPPLRQALSGLLFSHAELWQESKPLCSIVLMRDVGRVAFGWIGQAAVDVFVAGERIHPEWTLVRDHLGGEARAWSSDGRRDVLIEIVPQVASASEEPLARLLARWTGEENAPRVEQAPAAREEASAVAEAPASVETFAVEMLEPAAPPVEIPSLAETGEQLATGATFETLETAPVISSEEETPRDMTASEEPRETEEPDGAMESDTRPSHGVARWLARTFGHEGKREERFEPAQAEAEAPAALPAQTPPLAAEPPLPVAAEPPPPAIAEPLAPLAAEPPVAADPLPPEVPERIPPSPEPAALTARAVRESFPLEDPRAITLPAPQTGGAPAGEPAPPPEPPGNPQWAATLEALGAREPQGMSPAIRERILRSRTHESGWEPLEIETLAPAGEWTGVEPPIRDPLPEPEPEPSAPPAGAVAKRGIPRRPDWPAAPPVEKPIAWGRWALWTLFVLLLFGGGWMMGSVQNNDGAEQRPSGFALLLRQLGFGGARFDARVGSHPSGARISVDGKDTGLHTPATVSLTPGPHRLDLSLGSLGSASFRVEGKKGDEVPVNAPLWGSVLVSASDPSVPVAIAVDGVPRGFVPATIDSLSPGPHELRFTGPGMASWGSAIELHVGEQKEVLAYPLQSPATGLLQVRAVGSTDGDRESITGARVSIDGKPRGVTPLTLELSRGPHSVRVTRDKEEAPIQVIDLPGGNQRFATFEFGLTSEIPRIELRVPPAFSLEEPVLVSAAIANVSARDLREMWLHVRSADGTWRRYEMTVLEAQGGAVGAAPFPVAALNAEGSAQYYVSALSAQGDEIFTEMQTAFAAKPPARR